MQKLQSSECSHRYHDIYAAHAVKFALKPGSYVVFQSVDVHCVALDGAHRTAFVPLNRHQRGIIRVLALKLRRYRAGYHRRHRRVALVVIHSLHDRAEAQINYKRQTYQYQRCRYQLHAELPQPGARFFCHHQYHLCIFYVYAEVTVNLYKFSSLNGSVTGVTAYYNFFYIFFVFNFYKKG